MTLRETLDLMTVSDLKALHGPLPNTSRATRKADLIEALAAHLLSDKLKMLWEQLSELEISAVAEAVHNWGGYFDPVRFRAKYGALPGHFTRDPYDYWPRSRNPKPPSALRWLFYGRQIPEDLAARLSGLAPPPAALSIATFSDEQLPDFVKTGEDDDDTEPLARVATEVVVRQDLPAVLRLIAEGGVAVGAKTGIASAAAVAKLESMLLGGDWYQAADDRDEPRYAGGPIRPIRPFAWPLLLQVGGLAKLDGSKLMLTARGKKALSQPVHEVVAHLHERWLRKGAPDELRRVDLLKGQTSKGAKLTPPAERRQVIEDALAECCPVGHWISVDDLFRQMKVLDHLFEVSHNEWKLYFSELRYGSLGYDGGAQFEILQARYVLVYLFEYLATLGLIDVAYSLPYHARVDYAGYWGADEFSFLSRYDGLRYLRLNALGAYCLGLTDSYQERVEAKRPLFQVDADLELTLLRAPDPAERLQLDMIATRRSSGPISDQASDQASGQASGQGSDQPSAPASDGAAERWCLESKTILARGADADERGRIRDFIESSSEGSLPAEVRHLLDSVDERASALVDIGPARLIQCRDAALAVLLSTDPATAAHCHRAGDRLLSVPEKKLTPFRKGLTKLGFVLPEMQRR